jgi:hypothetical protein
MRRGLTSFVFLMSCALGCRPCFEPVSEMETVSDGGLSTADAGLASGSDAGTTGAVVFDAGTGILDAGGGAFDAGPGLDPLDAGLRAPDAGSALTDAGTADGGGVDAGLDAGVVPFNPNCPGPTYATAAELARPMRTEPWVEMLVIEGSGVFMVDDVDYARAAQDFRFVGEFRDAGILVSLLPDYLPDLLLEFDDAGLDALAAGTFTAFNCLNQAYGGAVSPLGPTGRVVSFRPLNVETLRRDYAGLPHVRSAEVNSIGTFSTCGYGSDLCVEPGGPGTWTWLAMVEGRDCSDTFYRVRTEADGGRHVEQWDAGAPRPTSWFEQSPRCAMNLWGRPWRLPDGGIVVWRPDGG